MTTPPRRCRAILRSTMTVLWLQLRARTQLRCEIPHLITKKQLAPTHRHQRQCRVLRQPWQWLREIGYGGNIRYCAMATTLFIIPYSGKAGSGLGNCRMLMRKYCATPLRHLDIGDNILSQCVFNVQVHDLSYVQLACNSPAWSFHTQQLRM